MKNYLGDLYFGLSGVALAGVLGCGLAGAQTHKVSKPETVVRAVGVYEWTGEMAKPTASRLIPVTLFIDGQLQDAGVYLARPVPFALLSGNVYELQQAGIGKGLLDLVYARHLQAVDVKTGDEAYDDGWFGYGAFKPEAATARRTTALRQSKTLSTVTSNSSDTRPKLTNATGSSGSATDPDRPTMKRRDDSSSGATTTTASTGTASTGSAGSSSGSKTTATADDPDRPTMKRRTDDSSGGTTTAASSSGSATTAPADDPDRPTMKRRDDSSASSSGTSTASASSVNTGSVPADDPDRPTMKRRTDDSASGGSSTGSGSADSSAPADDPNRPTMQRRTGDTSSDSSTASTGSVPAKDPERPTLKRRSPEDAKKRNDSGSSVTGVGSLNDDPNRPNLHRGKPVGSMTSDDLPQLKGMPTVETHQMVAVSDAKDRDPHDFTRPWEDKDERAAVMTKMEALARAQLTAYEAAAVPAAPAKPAPKTSAAARARSVKKPAAPPPVEALLDEELKGYTLSYGGSPTYVFQAHTAGTGAALRYVTVVAQPDGVGELQPALKSVTDAAHLDRTPRMRLVDAVDVEASNRASLLFELREQSSRQFALYRVIGARADQTFLTGTTQ